MSHTLGDGQSDAAASIHEVGDAVQGKTEWEDALIKHGIMKAPGTIELTQDDVDTAVAEFEATRDKLADKSLKELDELEDEVDERVLAQYRRARMEQLAQEASRNVFGSVLTISESDFIPEVSKAPADVVVLVHYFAPSKLECQLMDKILSAFARAFASVKCVRLNGQDCARVFPASMCPTVLAYRDGKLATQWTGLDAFGGMQATAKSLEWVLAQHKLIKSKLTHNPLQSVNLRRDNIIGGGGASAGGGARRGGGDDNEDDDDDDDDGEENNRRRTAQQRARNARSGSTRTSALSDDDEDDDRESW